MSNDIFEILEKYFREFGHHSLTLTRHRGAEDLSACSFENAAADPAAAGRPSIPGLPARSLRRENGSAVSMSRISTSRSSRWISIPNKRSAKRTAFASHGATRGLAGGIRIRSLRYNRHGDFRDFRICNGFQLFFHDPGEIFFFSLVQRLIIEFFPYQLFLFGREVIL